MKAIVLIILASFFTISCAHKYKNQVTKAKAVMHSKSGSKVSGVVTFEKTAKHSSRVIAKIKGLTPNAEHGFHIHELGDCSSKDGKSAGGHFNPTNTPHASPQADKHHIGDLGNLKANAKGEADLSVEFKHLMIHCPKCGVLGRGVVIHAKSDDFTSQPSGAAGKRIACGIIGATK